MIIKCTQLSSCFSPARIVIERKSVRPPKVRVDQNFAVGTVQISALNFSDMTPVCPEQIPKKSQRNESVSIRDATVPLNSDEYE